MHFFPDGADGYPLRTKASLQALQRCRHCLRPVHISLTNQALTFEKLMHRQHAYVTVSLTGHPQTSSTGAVPSEVRTEGRTLTTALPSTSDHVRMNAVLQAGTNAFRRCMTGNSLSAVPCTSQRDGWGKAASGDARKPAEKAKI